MTLALYALLFITWAFLVWFIRDCLKADPTNVQQYMHDRSYHRALRDAGIARRLREEEWWSPRR